MSIISDNVIPGNHGKTFETNAKTEEELDILKNAILEIEGIKDVQCIFRPDVTPNSGGN